ncbi:unnamed protein product [Protopolystoma xenopodis]|uniref:Uncharacterized protein n=1 Tax=Protopolystoma xenopodis TaxID=117903 RepID=A0A448XM48_9PLAT|nr:unnamed protein product [Protopolystoma xenopodis]
MTQPFPISSTASCAHVCVCSSVGVPLCLPFGPVGTASPPRGLADRLPDRRRDDLLSHAHPYSLLPPAYSALPPRHSPPLSLSLAALLASFIPPSLILPTPRPPLPSPPSASDSD